MHRLPMHMLPGIVACLMLAAAAPLARAAPPDWIPRSLPPITSAPELQDRIDTLRKGIWTLYQGESAGAPDVRRRTLKQDVDEYLMVPATASRLEALHGKAQHEESARQDAALKKTLDEASVLVQLEVYRGNLVNEYWYRQMQLREQKRLYDALEARLPAPVHAESPEITVAYADAGTQLTAALSAANPTLDQQNTKLAQLHATLEAIDATYNRQRENLGSAVGDAERANGVAPLTLRRTEPCPSSTTSTPVSAPLAHIEGEVSAKPARIDHNSPPLESFYPPALRRLGVQGAVVLATTVAWSGCATKAEVYSPSGVQALDESALKWALQATYFPAEDDGKPVQSVLRFRVRFQMRD